MNLCLYFSRALLPFDGCNLSIFFTRVKLAFTCLIFRKISRAKTFFHAYILAFCGIFTGKNRKKACIFHPIEIPFHAQKNTARTYAFVYIFLSVLMFDCLSICPYVIAYEKKGKFPFFWIHLFYYQFCSKFL